MPTQVTIVQNDDGTINANETMVTTTVAQSDTQSYAILLRQLIEFQNRIRTLQTTTIPELQRKIVDTQALIDAVQHTPLPNPVTPVTL